MAVVIATTKVRIFKQITTTHSQVILIECCYCYHKGTYFQANHNRLLPRQTYFWLLLLPQRYVFSSKSQPIVKLQKLKKCCYCYHKGTYFQANHNKSIQFDVAPIVVIATTKVRIFKQITTGMALFYLRKMLLLLPQRYVFSSKSQPELFRYFSLKVVIATTKVRIFKQITTRYVALC